MATHKHRTASTRTVAWTHCVDAHGGRCDGKAHGGVTHVDTCRCGAERLTESNGGACIAGPWIQRETYRIESWDERHQMWSSRLVGDDRDNRHDTEQEAQRAIRELRALGNEWATARYRVVRAEVSR